MRKITNVLGIFLILGLVVFSACSDDEDDDKVNVQAVVLASDFAKDQTLLIGATLDVAGKYVVTPAEATNKAVKITVAKTDEAFVTVSGTKITAKAVTTTPVKVTITSVDNVKATVFFSLTVAAVAKDVVSIVFAAPTAELEIDKVLTLNSTLLTFTPADATNKDITFTLKATTDIVTLVDGKVTGKKAGTATVVATSHNGKTAELAITVKAPAPTIVVAADAKAIALDMVTVKTYNLKEKLTVTPATAALTYTAVPADVVTISTAGVITAAKAGTAKIVVTQTATPTVKSEEITVTVTAAPVLPTIVVAADAKTITLEALKTYNLKEKLTVTPATAELTYKVLPATGILTVGPTGVITAIGAGAAVITVAQKDTPAVTATVNVTVTAAPVVEVEVESFSFRTAASKTMLVGRTQDLGIQILIVPTGATTTFTYTVAGDAVTVSPAGIVTAAKAGVATVTATSANSKTATFEITVTESTVTNIDWTVRTNWVVTASHVHLVPKTTDVNDIGLFGTLQSIIDTNDRSCLILVKPGKSYDGADGTISTPATDEISFTVDLKAATAFDHIFISPRVTGGVEGMIPKTVKLEGSDNGTTWVAMENAVLPLDPIKAPRASAPVKLAKTYTYKFIKVTYVDYHGTNGSTAQISDFKLGTTK